MGDTVQQVVHDFLDEMGMLETGVATGGADAKTTLIDSALIIKDDAWNKGSIFIEKSTDGAAPEGEAAQITDSAYAAATGTTFTFAALTAKVESGDIYSIGSPEMGWHEARRLLNRALRRMGLVPVPDTSLTAAAGTQKYTLPEAIKGKIRRIYIQNSATATDPQWEERTDFREHPTAKGTDGYLLFDSALPDGTMKIVYMDLHPAVWAYSDEISEYVPRQRLVAEMVYLYQVESLRRTEGEDKARMSQMRLAAEELTMARREFKIWDPGNSPKLIRRSLD